MKKSLAVLSASVLGIGAAATAGAAPASADLPQCTSSTDHTVSATADGTQDWYMDCIPQYGLGKAEFTITTPASHPFPGAYTLSDGHQTVTSSVNSSATTAYFGTATTGAFTDVGSPAVPSSTSQQYDTSAVFPVVSAGKLTGSLPTDCTEGDETYQGAYIVTFAPTTTTFKETISGTTWSVTVTVTPAPLILGLNFANGALDPTAPLCVSSGGVTSVADDSTDPNWAPLSVDQVTRNASNGSTLDPGAGGDLVTDGLGSVAVSRSGTSTTSGPGLALTGIDPLPAGILGGGLLGGGLLFFLFGWRRRVARQR